MDYFVTNIKDITGISEDFKIDFTTKLDNFLKDDKQKVLKFSPNLTSNDRKYIHNYCVTYRLNTKSHGFGDERYITIKKKDTEVEASTHLKLPLSLDSQKAIISLNQILKQFNSFKDNDYRYFNNGRNSDHFHCRSGRLSKIRPNVPNTVTTNTRNWFQFKQFREELPIFRFRDEILNTIAGNRVVVISGDTGCGKTTQVPQYLLEYCAANRRECRIVCAEPRRLAAISVSERVCAEMGEQLGGTVGYQIRLENRVSADTLLTFCTNGVILRTLMANREDFVNNVTHVIIDEVHERDRFSDFLLLIMKDLITRHPNIKLILMSATFNIRRFSEYFGDCPVIEIPGRLYEVEPYFLEDVLKIFDYMSVDMAHYKQQLERNARKKGESSDCAANTELLDRELDPEVKENIELRLKNAWVDGTDAAFDELLALISTNGSLIDYKHSETGVTPLIVAAGRNKPSIVEAFLCFGANPSISTPNDMSAIDWAKYFGHEVVITYLTEYCVKNGISMGSNLSADGVQSVLTEEEKELLDIYHHCFNDDGINSQLICHILAQLLKSSALGAILVFLPGFDDIIKIKDTIAMDTRRFVPNKYSLFILHSQMQSADQKRVFQILPNNERKIILSTNIAETSITIDDVGYVLDCGKVKEKSFDSLMGISQLKCVWTSQSSVLQRRGRAGRTKHGVCYHLFSKIRFQSMQKHQLPEILRIPIHEVCLQSKLLAPNNDVGIHDFLSSAMDPPSIASVRASVQLLKTIDALDSTEQLTKLGVFLLDLPIEPNFGKMILYAIVLKCVDPVITIVSALTYRDPFIIPTHSEKQKTLKEIRKRFSLNQFSDHLIYLTAFNEWQKACQTSNPRVFCREHFLSYSTLELMAGIRQQILSQLKSSGLIKNIYECNKNSDKWCVVKAALCAGAYPKLIRFDENRRQFITQKEKTKFHTSSQLTWDPNTGKFLYNGNKLMETMPTDWVVYEELVLIGRTSHAKCCTAITPLTVALFCGPNCSSQQMTTDADIIAGNLKVDEWMTFGADAHVVKMVSYLRQELHNLFVRKLDFHMKNDEHRDEVIVDTVVKMLETEEHNSGFAPIDGFCLTPQRRPQNTYSAARSQNRQFSNDKRGFYNRYPKNSYYK